ncbi:MAG TPA: aminodeoxychorismate/anthranilate synthase component I, partial [Rhodospirillales bacterium]|nr:aminodeoxychorismate/anthranilate synthase component I [Rhodospirillales bacterium]
MTPELSVRSVPYLDPIRAFAPFSGDPYGAFLDGGGRETGGRYSYIATDPYRVVGDGGGDPFTALEEELDRFRLPARPGLPPFQTGAA